MLPAFMVPENIVRADGASVPVDLGEARGSDVLITLGITRIIEQESLDLSLYGSADGETWEKISGFPQKFYCGTYSLYLDLARHPHVRYLRAQWRMNRWGHGDRSPLFGFYVFAEQPSRVRQPLVARAG